MGLTSDQHLAVENRGGTLLVSAAAGSGKTRVLVERLLSYLLDPRDPANIDDFLMITYTKAAAAELKNCKFLIADAVMLPDICPAGSVDVLYLNFSDPWPKNRDRKRRLTHINFLETYKKLLKPNGILRIKTDNVGLFDFTLEQLELAGFEMFDLTRDLHNSDIANEVMTEYEKRFSELGFPINAVKARIKRN